MNPVSIGRVVWPGPVGIGAGLVKNGAMLLDFAKNASSVEIGSITRHLREGNGGKTVWKYLEEKSLRHNAGMPNYGAEHLAEDLIKVQGQMNVPWGINVAVSPGITDNDEAAIDIGDCMSILLNSGLEPDWITVNVASPDTLDKVENLSDPERVKKVLFSVKSIVTKFDDTPVWLKVGPGMDNSRMEQLGQIALDNGVEALVCGNTYPDLAGGGWCGKVVEGRSNALLAWLKGKFGDRLALIGVGGVMNGQDADHKISLGATAVQAVSALLMRGREAAKIIETEME